jgi:membrane protease YdiL (CAAX protease family)
MVAHGLYIFLVLRPTKKGLKYSFWPLFTDITSYWRALFAVMAFISTGLPLGIVTSFISFSPKEDLSMLEILLIFFLIYFFIALIEEFLFRALIQGMIEDWIDFLIPAGSPVLASLRKAAMSVIKMHEHSDVVPFGTQAPPPLELTHGIALQTVEAADADSNEEGKPDLNLADEELESPLPVYELSPGDESEEVHWPRHSPSLFCCSSSQDLAAAQSESSLSWTAQLRLRLKEIVAFFRISRNAFIALLIASVIFGAAHLDNKTSNHSPPNWIYGVEATLAGFLYGM